jgi:hypothetical protein
MRKIPGIYEENGYTKVRVWLGPKRNPNGSINRPYRRSFGPYSNENIQRAKNHIEAVRDNFKKGIRPAPEPEPLAVPSACDIYHDRHWVKNHRRTPEAIRNIGYKLNSFRIYWPTQALHNLLPNEIERYVAWRKGSKLPEDQPVTGAACVPVSASTVDNELNILSSMFGMIEKWQERREIGPYLLPTNTHGVPFNPVGFVERDSLIGTKRERSATRNELVKGKEYCDAKDPDMLVMIERSITTGLRKTDLQKVNGLADVRGVLSKSKEKKLFRMPVDFSRRIDYTNFDRRWDAFRKACGMEDFHWHDWRHTAGTMLSLLGFTDEQIQQFYGHATVQQTRDYINTGKERLRAHVEGLQGHLKDVWKDVQPPAAIDLTKKVCRGCGVLKPLEAYGKHLAFKSGLDSRCKVCNYQRLVEQRKRNPAIREKEYANNRSRAVSSVVEHRPHTTRVAGSSPALPTISMIDHGVSNSVSK